MPRALRGILYVVMVAAWMLDLSLHAQAGRPTLLLLHGRDQPVGRGAEVEAQWHLDIDAGLASAGAAGLVPRNARRFFWYTDMLAKRRACHGDTPGGVKVEGIVALRDFFARVARLMPNDAQRAVVDTTMADTSAYLSNLHIQCYLEGSLGNLLERAPAAGGPIVAIAHSMGSLVLFKSLFARLSGMGPVYLITIGSMLPEPAVQRSLLGSLVAFPGPIPQAVVWWRNLINDGDVLAFEASAAFASEQPVKIPQDVRIATGTGANRHDASLYLRSPEFGRLVRAAWCLANPDEPLCAAR